MALPPMVAPFLLAIHNKMHIWLYLFISRLPLFSFFPFGLFLELQQDAICKPWFQWASVTTLGKIFAQSCLPTWAGYLLVVLIMFFLSFLFPCFVQGLNYSDSVISSSSLHFPQWFFSNNIVQNPNVWFPVFPPIKTSLSALSPKLFLLKFIICRKGFKSFVSVTSKVSSFWILPQ